MLAMCMTIHRVQGVGFPRLTVWSPALGQALYDIFLVIGDEFRFDRQTARQFLQGTFHPPVAEIAALEEMRKRVLATDSPTVSLQH